MRTPTRSLSHGGASSGGRLLDGHLAVVRVMLGRIVQQTPTLQHRLDAPVHGPNRVVHLLWSQPRRGDGTA